MSVSALELGVTVFDGMAGAVFRFIATTGARSTNKGAAEDAQLVTAMLKMAGSVLRHVGRLAPERLQRTTTSQAGELCKCGAVRRCMLTNGRRAIAVARGIWKGLKKP